MPILADEQLTAVVGLLAARGYAISDIGTYLPSLDEVFLSITGQKPGVQDSVSTQQTEEVAA